MGPSTIAVSAVQKMMKKSAIHGSPCGSYTKCHTSGRNHCLAKDSTCHSCQKIGQWKQKCRNSNKAKDVHKKPKSQPQCWHGGRKMADEVGVSEGDPAFDEIMIHAWLANQKRLQDPKQITHTDISIDLITKTFTTVDLSNASKKRASLWKLQKLECPQDYKNAIPSSEITMEQTYLNSVHWTPITWKDKETKEVNKMDTTFYIANTPGPAILGLLSCSGLRIVNLNCSVWLRKHDQPIKTCKEKSQTGYEEPQADQLQRWSNEGLLTHAKCSGQDPYLTLLPYRSTPVDSHLWSPTEMLYQYALCTTVSQRIKHKVPYAAVENERLEEHATLSAASHDHTGCHSICRTVCFCNQQCQGTVAPCHCNICSWSCFIHCQSHWWSWVQISMRPHLWTSPRCCQALTCIPRLKWLDNLSPLHQPQMLYSKHPLLPQHNHLLLPQHPNKL